MSRDPYRLIFWAPGHVGGTALRCALSRPEFEVVGALVYSPEKDGVDVGELVGTPPVGVTATRDKEAILALDADCVIHAPQAAIDESEMVEDVARLLESGKNVISVTSFFHPGRRAQRCPSASSAHATPAVAPCTAAASTRASCSSACA